MELVEVTWHRALAIFWFLFWRAFTIAFVVGFVIGFVYAIATKEHLPTYMNYVVGLPISLWVTKTIFSKKFKGFSVVLVKA